MEKDPLPVRLTLAHIYSQLQKQAGIQSLILVDFRIKDPKNRQFKLADDELTLLEAESKRLTGVLFLAKTYMEENRMEYFDVHIDFSTIRPPTH